MLTFATGVYARKCTRCGHFECPHCEHQHTARTGRPAPFWFEAVLTAKETAVFDIVPVPDGRLWTPTVLQFPKDIARRILLLSVSSDLASDRFDIEDRRGIDPLKVQHETRFAGLLMIEFSAAKPLHIRIVNRWARSMRVGGCMLAEEIVISNGGWCDDLRCVCAEENECTFDSSAKSPCAQGLGAIEKQFTARVGAGFDFGDTTADDGEILLRAKKRKAT